MGQIRTKTIGNFMKLTNWLFRLEFKPLYQIYNELIKIKNKKNISLVLKEEIDFFLYFHNTTLKNSCFNILELKGHFKYKNYNLPIDEATTEYFILYLNLKILKNIYITYLQNKKEANAKKTR